MRITPFKETSDRLCFFILSLIVVTPLLASCTSLNPCQEKDVNRQTSQDDIVDAVTVEKDCGATTPKSTIVYIKPKGKSVANHTPVLVSDNVKGFEVNWIRPKYLSITYTAARIFQFTNFWNSKDVDQFNYQVTIREREKAPN